jgi:hypothetical protein
MDGLRRAFTPAVVLFVALPETENKADTGVIEIPLKMLPSTMPILWRANDHRSRTAAQTTARSPAPTDLDSPGPLSSLPEDIYSAAGLVAVVRALQPALSATSLGVDVPNAWHLGAIRS